jgi:hypothetical protein
MPKERASKDSAEMRRKKGEERSGTSYFKVHLKIELKT